VQAFFKRQGNQLVLNWPVYAQGRYRLLEKFSSGLLEDKEAKFRVIMREGEIFSHLDPEGTKAVFRIGDWSYQQSSYRALILNEALAQEMTTGYTRRVNPEQPDFPIAATVRLKLEEGRIVILDLICWEFEGLGAETESP